jgi:hypothetical protein
VQEGIKKKNAYQESRAGSAREKKLQSKPNRLLVFSRLNAIGPTAPQQNFENSQGDPTDGK